MTSYNATRADDWGGGAVVTRNQAGAVVARPEDRMAASRHAAGPPPGAGPTRYEVVEHRQNQQKYPYEEAMVAGPNSAYSAPPSLAPTSAFDYVFGSDISATFWKPNPAKGQRGLLEELNRRTTSNSTYLLVSSRPDEELAHNFSTADDRMFNLNHDQFKLSRTMLAFNRLDNVEDEMNITGRDFKAGLKSSLPSLQQEVYYVLKYRDYSDWAVKNHYSSTKRDGTWRPLYVEKYFALKTGACAGVLIPITEAQLIYGHELLMKEALNIPKSPSADNAANDAINSRYALTADQFRSIGVVVDESVFVNPYLDPSTGRQQAAPPPAPSLWDWTPFAMKRRFDRYLEEQYVGLGRLVVRGVIVGVCGYIALRSIRNLLGPANEPQGGIHQRRGRSRRGYVEEPSARGIISSVVGFSPKSVFDAILA